MPRKEEEKVIKYLPPASVLESNKPDEIIKAPYCLVHRQTRGPVEHWRDWMKRRDRPYAVLIHPENKKPVYSLWVSHKIDPSLGHVEDLSTGEFRRVPKQDTVPECLKQHVKAYRKAKKKGLPFRQAPVGLTGKEALD